MNLLSRPWLVPVLAIVILLLLVAWVAGIFTAKLAPGLTETNVVDAAMAIKVVRVEQPIYEPVPASIQAKQTTVISSRILSRIQKVHVRAGDSVVKGQLLVELEQLDLQSRVSQAKARVNAVSARLIEARQSLKRAITLSETGLIARSDLDKAQANHDALLADVANAKQAANEAETSLAFARVYAPMDGRIVDRLAEPGDTVQPGIPMLTLYNPASLRIEAHVREALALSLMLEQPLTVLIPSAKRRLISTIEELVPAGNPGSRNFLVKSRLPVSEGLLPGMYAQVQVPAGSKSLLLVPREYVAKVGQLDVVWVNAQGVMDRRFIRTGKVTDEGLVEVISGLQQGELLMPVPTTGS